MSLYNPPDIDEAHEQWRANCGPCAVAAVLGRDMGKVRELFEPWPGYSNPTLIRRAVERAGKRLLPATIETVETGLGFVQFEGPWEAGGARAAYRHTHWVGLARRSRHDGEPPQIFVYDAAAHEVGGWITLEAFGRVGIPMYLEDEPKATGWRFRQVFEVFDGR